MIINTKFDALFVFVLLGLTSRLTSLVFGSKIKNDISYKYIFIMIIIKK